MQSFHIKDFYQSFLDIPHHLKILIFFLIVSIFFCNADLISTIVSRWFTSPHMYGHGILIFGITIYIVWTKKDILIQLSIKPALITGSLILLLGCFMLFSGKLSMTITLYEISIIFTLFGLTLLLLGFGYLKALFVPLAYLVFMFPIFDTIPGRHIIFLQYVSAFLGSIFLGLTGFPVFQHGYVLELPHISLNIVKACAGVNHIVSLSALALFIGYATNMSRLGKFILVIFAIVISVLANGSRIALIGIWTYYNKNAELHGPADLLFVSFNFLVGLTILVAFVFLCRKLGLFKGDNANGRKISNISKMNRKISGRFSTAIIIAIIVFSITGFGLFYRELKPLYLARDLNTFPKSIENWTGKDVVALGGPFETVVPDTTLKRVYNDPHGNQVNLFIGYFALQKTGKEIFDSSYNELLTLLPGSRIVKLPVNNLSELNTMQFQYSNHGSKIAGYAWYVINGKFYANQYFAKLLTFYNIIAKAKNNAAIVFVTANCNEESRKLQYVDPINKFTSAIVPVLTEYLDL